MRLCVTDNSGSGRDQTVVLFFVSEGKPGMEKLYRVIIENRESENKSSERIVQVKAASAQKARGEVLLLLSEIGWERSAIKLHVCATSSGGR